MKIDIFTHVMLLRYKKLLLFGTDLPCDVENGGVSIRETIKAIDNMKIPASTKEKIYEGNARRLLHL